jgi:hypothetical protein
MGVVDNERVLLLREALAQSGWVERTRDFARSLRRVPEPGRLLLVGTPQEEPWHLAAHLDDEARYSGLVQLAPTLVRWSPPPGAPPHLAVTMARLEAAARDETVFVVSPHAAPEALLERVADARRVGATVLAIDAGDDELAALAHDRIAVPTTSHQRLILPDMSFADMTSAIDFDTVSHLVSVAAGENVTSTTMRQRMARLIERMSGPSPRS